MSLVSAAIIAGATAGLTGVAKKAIEDLYSELKALILDKHSAIGFSLIESNPKDPNQRNVISDQLDQLNLDSDSVIRQTAENLIKTILQENVPLDKGALMTFKELKAKQGIILEDIDLDQRLIEADTIETEGEFRASGIRHKNSSHSNAGPAIQIDDLKANVANFFLKSIYSIPRYIRISVVVIVVISLATLATIGVLAFIESKVRSEEDLAKRDNFDETVRNLPTPNYQSSFNYIISVLPNNVKVTRNADHWEKFSYSWNKHIYRIEAAFRPLAIGLTDDSMRGGETKESVCKGVRKILETHFTMAQRLGDIAGIGLDFSDSNVSELSVFGPVIKVPNTKNMQIVFKNLCPGKLEEIINPPDLRTEEQKTSDRILVLNTFIKELEDLKSINVPDELVLAQEKFIGRYSSWLISKGMPRSDARWEAKGEVKDLLSGGRFNYQIGGLNDIGDRVRYLQKLQSRDIDAEILEIKEEIDRLEQLSAKSPKAKEPIE